MHKNLPCLLVLKLYLDNRSSYLTVATHVYHYCHRKTFSKPVLVRFYFHDDTWTDAFHGPHKVSKLHDRRVHAAHSVLTMNVQKWIVLSLKIRLTLSKFIFLRMFGCNLISLLPSVAYSAHRQSMEELCLFLRLGFIFLKAHLTKKVSQHHTSTLVSISGIRSGRISLLTFR